MLVITDRHTSDDLDRWKVHAMADQVNALRTRSKLEHAERKASQAMRDFVAAGGGGYLGVSWGKDSVVCAYLLHLLEREGVRYPAVWVRVRDLENPDCELVRDEFLRQFPLSSYDEIEAERGADLAGKTSQRGFAEAARRYGDRHVSGVRADESAVRRIVMRRWGYQTARTCRPIGFWSTSQVFTYCHMRGLPLHPAYGYTGGGRWSRDRLRTAAIGGDRGTEFGRREWEQTYYPEASLLAAESRGRV